MATTSEATLQFLEVGHEADLVARAQMGDRAAFLELARHYQRPLYRVLFALCLDEERAAAHTREAFVRASEQLAEYPIGAGSSPGSCASPAPSRCSTPARGRNGTGRIASSRRSRPFAWMTG